MSIKKLFATLCAALIAGSIFAAGVELNPNHPDRYVVVKGDTLWGIAAKFLREPWYWPEIWYVNPQVANPHLIYPGDVLTLVYVGGKPQLRLDHGAEKLSPKIRVENLEQAIPTIPIEAISQFLTKPLVVSQDQLNHAPYVVAGADEHVVTGAGDRVYARGIKGEDIGVFDIFEPGGPLIDPDTNEVLGYQGIYVGEGAVKRFGDPATLLLTETAREARVGDRLWPTSQEKPITHFLPHPAPPGTEGRIISVLGGVQEIGQFNVVAINRGAADGIEVGHVMKIFQTGDTVRDTVGGKRAELVKLPDEEAGVLMVFRTFDRVSYCLVMEATRSMHLLDIVRTP
jgi:hypothetical protein